jgi:hypothetical protein
MKDHCKENQLLDEYERFYTNGYSIGEIVKFAGKVYEITGSVDYYYFTMVSICGNNYATIESKRIEGYADPADIARYKNEN